MPTFQRCDNSVNELAAGILTQFETYQEFLDARVTVDYVFAYPDLEEETGAPKGAAIMHHGVKALGLARIVPLKDRALGRADAEVMLDGDWWKDASEQERAALLDHELHHFDFKREKNASIKRDDLNRPALKMRKHDVDIGWFKLIAARHGRHSMERMQAKQILDEAGQFFWPELVGSSVTIS